MPKTGKVNLTSDDSLFEKSLNLQKYIEDLSLQAINFADKFSFSWAGKSNAIKSVLIPSKLTLNPEPKQSIKWDESENLFIEGDNLEVLKLLQKAYFEKVKMIYIDPPYNTGHDFVYKDDFSSPLGNYLKQTGQKSENGESNTTNKETNGRYHSDWLSMMYPRLKLAWNLLREDGVIYVSINDNEVHHLRIILNEIFGEENSLTDSPTALIWQGSGTTAGHFASAHEYILCYAKVKNKLPFFALQDYGDESVISHGALKKISKANPASEITFPAGFEFEGDSKTFSGEIGGSEKQIINGEMIFSSGKLTQPVTVTAGWAMKDQVLSYISGEETYDTKGQKVLRFFFNKEGILWYEKERGTIHPKTILPKELGTTKTGSVELENIFNAKVFDFPKPTNLIAYLISFTTKADDVVLDFFAGTGVTAHAVLKQNAEDKCSRKFISVQLPEKLDEKSEGFKAGYKTISDIAKERIRRVIKGYGNEPRPIDAGFKVFTLAESNYPENNFVLDVDKSQEENKKAFVDYLNKAKQSQLFDKENDTSLIYENIVKEGLSLNSKVEKVSIGKNSVYRVTDGEQQLLICLESKLASETVKELTDKSQKGKIFICLESSLDDTNAANLSLNLDLKTI